EPLAVFQTRVVLLPSAPAPLAVLSKPSVLCWSAAKPKAVLLTPSGLLTPTLMSARVPPAVLKFSSVTVGLQPGATQTGVWPQLGVMVRRRKNPATIGTRRAKGFIESSMRRTIRRTMRERARPSTTAISSPVFTLKCLLLPLQPLSTHRPQRLARVT